MGIEITAEPAPRGYVVETPAFTGPFDLLLQLITRHQLDICDVPLAAIVDDYLAEIERMEGLDLNLATAFLLCAATLIELKTLALLPEPDDIDLDEELALFEERDLLISRLLAAKTFKDASRSIERLLEEGSGYHARTAGLEEPFLYICPDLLARLSPDDLAEIAARALAGRPSVDVSHIAMARASVRDAMATLARRLPGRGTRVLRELVADATSRLDVLVVVLGLLELYKQGLVRLSQAVRFGELSAAWTGPAQGGVSDWSGAAEWDAVIEE